MTTPSAFTAKSRSLTRQRFVMRLAATWARRHPHMPISHLEKAFERAGDLYLQACNRNSGYEETAVMQSIAQVTADKLSRWSDCLMTGSVSRSPMEIVESFLGKPCGLDIRTA